MDLQIDSQIGCRPRVAGIQSGRRGRPARHQATTTRSGSASLAAYACVIFADVCISRGGLRVHHLRGRLASLAAYACIIFVGGLHLSQPTRALLAPCCPQPARSRLYMRRRRRFCRVFSLSISPKTFLLKSSCLPWRHLRRICAEGVGVLLTIAAKI